jgi:signal transduction histidine kinase
MSDPAPHTPVAANDAVSEAHAAETLSATARSWPGAALAIGPRGRVIAASPLSGIAENMRCPFELPVAPIASQVVDSAGRRWRVSAPVAGVRLATADLKEEPDAAHRFTAAVSHEIRTPLNGILGMAALLEETELTPAQQDYTSAIRKSGSRLLDLLNNVLDFARMDAGDIPLDAAPFDPSDLVQDVAELLAPRAHANGLDIAAIVDPDLPKRLIGDAGRLRQILFNLAGNAVKFTERGAVLIEARPGARGKGLALIVRDTGAGVPEHARPRLFDAFSQASVGDSRRDGGVGLGLAIVSRLVAAMKGKVQVSSEWGLGALFHVELPLEPGPEPAQHKTVPAAGPLRVALDLPPASGLACIAALAGEGARPCRSKRTMPMSSSSTPRFRRRTSNRSRNAAARWSCCAPTTARASSSSAKWAAPAISFGRCAPPPLSSAWVLLPQRMPSPNPHPKPRGPAKQVLRSSPTTTPSTRFSQAERSQLRDSASTLLEPAPKRWKGSAKTTIPSSSWTSACR